MLVVEGLDRSEILESAALLQGMLGDEFDVTLTDIKNREDLPAHIREQLETAGYDCTTMEGESPILLHIPNPDRDANRRTRKLREVGSQLGFAGRKAPLNAQFRMKRALELIPPILEDFRAGRGNFTPDVLIAPQVRHVPAGMTPGSPEHVNFLFFVEHHMRGAITSHGAFRGHVLLYALHPELYDAATVRYADPIDVAEKIRDARVGLGFAAFQIGEIWVHNARVLMERFGGDPLNLYRGAKSFGTIVRRAIGKNVPKEMRLKGMRQKILSLLTIFYQGLDLVPHYRDQTMPMDLQILRLLIMLGILQVDRPVFRADEPLLRKARAFSGKLTRALGVTADELSHALWFQGSEICHRSPDNTFATPTFDEILAVSTPDRSLDTTMLTSLRKRYELGDGGQSTLVELLRRPRRTESDLCLSCPVMTRCTKAISAVPYYTIGFIFIRERPAYEDRYLELHALRRKAILAAPVALLPTIEHEQHSLFAA